MALLSLIAAKGLATSTKVSPVVPVRFGPHEGMQFRRCGCASTPACGSEVWAFGPAFTARLKPCP